MSLTGLVLNDSKMLKKRNVIGIAEGMKYTNGIPTGEPAVVVLVDRKMPMSSLSRKEKVPPKMDGFKTDVFRVGQMESLALNAKTRPVVAGFSCSHAWTTAGTIGGIFLKNGNPVILSNNHVIAASNKGKIGNAIINPGKYDGGNVWNPNHRIARLKAFKRMAMGGNYEDSAIGALHRRYREEIYGIGRIMGVGTPTMQMAVQKSGRTTGHTTGKIIGLHARVRVSYGGGVVRTFKDCVISTAMARGGDSGSLLIDMDNNVVGLLFAGSSKVTIYNDIKYPINTYDLKLIAPPAPPVDITEKNIKIYKDNALVGGSFNSIAAALDYSKEKAAEGSCCVIRPEIEVKQR